MPKQVDYESRRRRIAEAVCLLADEHGPEGVSMRDVAARAQVSLGAVQRCFRTKEEMLRFAVDHVGERITERVRARLAANPARSAATALGHATDEIALLREEHRAEARIWLAFVAQAAVSEPLAGPLRTSYAALQNLLVRLVTEAAASGPADGGAAPPDPRHEARTLLALADGLTTHVLVGHVTAEEAGEVLHAHLAGLLERLGTRP
ncbi:TetR/AcrR family transcriptional regulator [Streptomyces griseus]|uniref:TetR/AcrR family transcriptional regulator n=1 Tax=Streptomyces griseus TaxID=1911 RepID=UPI00084051DF|nr:TetR family transcriptional regulator C-terminal domain-containing protein [Streptomyces griseus]